MFVNCPYGTNIWLLGCHYSHIWKIWAMGIPSRRDGKILHPACGGIQNDATAPMSFWSGALAERRVSKVVREMLRCCRFSRMTGDILSANQYILPGLPKWDPIGVFLTYLPLFLTAPRKNRAYGLPLPE